MPEMLVVMAQSPRATRMRVRSRTSRIFSRFLLGADGPFDDRDVDIMRILARIDQRAVNQIRLRGDHDDPFVHVEQRHVAAGTAIQPHRGQPRLLHVFASRFAASSMTKRLRLVISSTAWPFSTSAPVGQTWTHLPQLVQDWRLAPRAVEFGHEHRIDAARRDVPDMRPFDLVADTDASRAEDAAIVVQAPSEDARRPPAGAGSCKAYGHASGPGSAPATAIRNGRWRHRRSRHGSAR